MTGSFAPLTPRSGAGFVGREAELETLNHAIDNEATRIICLSGERGAGKTALATQIFRRHRDYDVEFEETHYIPGHGRNAEALLDDLYRKALPSPTTKTSPDDLPGLITDCVSTAGSRNLFFIDNVEEATSHSRLFGKLVKAWAGSTARSVLMITTRRSPLETRQTLLSNSYLHLAVSGLREPSAVLALVGDSLRYRYSAERLLGVSDRLGDLPQRLLYLRWTQPNDIEGFPERFSAHSDLASVDALRRVLTLVPGSAVLLCLGLFRATEYTEDLLRFLWRHWQGEAKSQWRFSDFLSTAIEHRVFTDLTTHQTQYRLHPDVHLDLRRLAEEQSRGWLRAIHRQAVDYFASVVRTSEDDLSALTDYVHHSLASGGFNEAYRTVMDTDAFDRWRNMGLSLKLQPCVEQLNEITKTTPIFSQLQRAQISLGLSHIASDLGRPTLCLEHLGHALVELDGVVREPEVETVLRKTWMQMAISHANLGHVSECIDYYSQVIASDRTVSDPQTALCMGYLGYEYCDLREFVLADSWTKRALQDCSVDRNTAVFAKNLCNRGLVMFYQGAVDQAEAHIEHAIRLVSEPSSPAADVREHGRALSHLAVVHLAQQDRDLDLIEGMLVKSIALTRTSGDARRTALSIGRLGLVAVARGDGPRAVSLVGKAIRVHKSLGDTRNMILELLNLVTIVALQNGLTLPPDVWKALRTVNQADVPSDIKAIANHFSPRSPHAYLTDFWLECHMPRYFQVR